VRVLGVDYGHVRVGLALSDPGGILAQPWGTLEPRSLKDAARRILEAALSTEAEAIVLGLPLLLSGEEGAAALRVRELALALRRRSPLPVHLWDERLTSVAASRAMADDGLDERARRGRLDPVAAAIMLQSWLDAGSPPSS
jgi:putative Holliday junction resolvase